MTRPRSLNRERFSAFRQRTGSPRDTLGDMSVITNARLVLPRTVVRFAVIGMVNTTVDIVLFWVLHAPLGIVVANFVSTSAGMTFSFLANGRYTFGSSRVTVRQAALFLATNGFTMWLLQPLLIHAAYDLAAVPLMAAKVVALAGSVVVNFLLYRHVVWGKRTAEPEERGHGVGERRLSEPTAELAKS